LGPWSWGEWASDTCSSFQCQCSELFCCMSAACRVCDRCKRINDSECIFITSSYQVLGPYLLCRAYRTLAAVKQNGANELSIPVIPCPLPPLAPAITSPRTSEKCTRDGLGLPDNSSPPSQSGTRRMFQIRLVRLSLSPGGTKASGGRRRKWAFLR
jgi:hypothetical protein